MRLIVVGLIVGVGVALIAVRVLRSMVYDLPVHDALSFALAVTAMGAVALLASWLPARSAARIDPLASLREE